MITSPSAPEILSFFQSMQPTMVEWLVELVDRDTPSHCKPALDSLASDLAQRFRHCGASTQFLDSTSAGNHLLVRFFPANSERRQILLLGHLDTVWDLGECQRRPARIEGGRVFGPGSFDMRGGLVVMLAAARFLAHEQIRLDRPVTILLVSDEETGSLSSRPYIEREAAKSEAALVLEPSLPGGGVKTARKGVGRFRITAHGIAAHSGTDYERGASAILELARQVLQLCSLNDLAQGTTVNVGVIRGGTRPNVVADLAEMEVDLRCASLAEGERLTRLIQDRKAVDPRVRLEIEGGINRPPLERTEKVVDLYLRARALASEIGMDLQEGSVGGGSDGCFTAAMGVPTLDGLGPDGDGLHALQEHVLIDSLAPRAALLTLLLTRL